MIEGEILIEQSKDILNNATCPGVVINIIIVINMMNINGT